MQLFVDCDPRLTYFDLMDAYEEAFLRFAVFDLIANNADRKGGHCLLGNDGRVWSIDHGLTLHPHFKVRTVMLEMWGNEIPDKNLDDARRVLDQVQSRCGVATALEDSVSRDEMDALCQRIEFILKHGALPMLDPYRHVPWPLE